MGSKLRPGAYDCYEKAAPDEPMFILLARDASAPALVEMWAHDRERHGEEAGVVAEARECAEQMRAWRDRNRPPIELPPVGWIILTTQPDGTWKDDWDGNLHTDRTDADDALAKASVALGSENVRLVECRDL